MGTVDDAAVVSSFVVTLDSQGTIAGTVGEADDTFTFTPNSLPMADGLYTVSFDSVDTYGNSESHQFFFTIDSVPPAKPIITGGTVSSGVIEERPTENVSDQFIVNLTGIRDAGTSVWINRG